MSMDVLRALTTISGVPMPDQHVQAEKKQAIDDAMS
jgi:hypothetical protein